MSAHRRLVPKTKQMTAVTTMSAATAKKKIIIPRPYFIVRSSRVAMAAKKCCSRVEKSNKRGKSPRFGTLPQRKHNRKTRKTKTKSILIVRQSIHEHTPALRLQEKHPKTIATRRTRGMTCYDRRKFLGDSNQRNSMYIAKRLPLRFFMCFVSSINLSRDKQRRQHSQLQTAPQGARLAVQKGYTLNKLLHSTPQ